MTRVEMIYDNNIIIGFRMEGHAGFNLNGPDILCASLSTASQMTINGILDWTGLSVEDIVLAQNELYAVLFVQIPDEHVSHMTTQQLLKSFEMYVESLEEQYAKFIILERRQKYDK